MGNPRVFGIGRNPMGVDGRNDGEKIIVRESAPLDREVLMYRLLARWYRLRLQGIGPHLLAKPSGLYAFTGPIQQAVLELVTLEDMEALVVAGEAQAKIVTLPPKMEPARSLKFGARGLVRGRMAK